MTLRFEGRNSFRGRSGARPPIHLRNMRHIQQGQDRVYYRAGFPWAYKQSTLFYTQSCRWRIMERQLSSSSTRPSYEGTHGFLATWDSAAVIPGQHSSCSHVTTEPGGGTLPNPRKARACITMMKSLEQRHRVLIQDLWGRGANPILKPIEFHHLWHDLLTREQSDFVKSISIPQTEKLIRQVLSSTDGLTRELTSSSLCRTQVEIARVLFPQDDYLSTSNGMLDSTGKPYCLMVECQRTAYIPAVTPVGALRNLKVSIKDAAERDRFLENGHVLAINGCHLATFEARRTRSPHPTGGGWAAVE